MAQLHSSYFIASATSAALLLVPCFAHAQVPGARSGGPPEVEVQASVHLPRPATHLRMYLQLSAKGKTLEEALAALKERREAVAARLEKLGAEKSSVTFTDTAVDATGNAQQQRIEAMMAQRMAARGGKKPAKTAKPPVGVTTLLTAQWPLAGDSTEKCLLAAEAIHDKVKAADLSGSKETSKLSAEDQEVAEESAPQAPSMGNDEEQVKPGEARFVYVAEVSDQDRQKALVQAFAKAKAHATELAQAAGAGLGPLTRLSGSSNTNSNGAGYGNWRYNPYAAREYEFLQQMAQAGGGGDEQSNQILSPKPDGIGFDFVVNATFALDAAAKK